MLILGVKTNHDGVGAILRDGRLEISLEGEKNSHPRHSHLKPQDLLGVLSQIDAVPDTIAVGGWHSDPISRHYPDDWDRACAYLGLEHIFLKRFDILGKKVSLFASSHERSHIFCSYGLSPFEQGRSCYILIWEGNIGRFYKIGRNLSIESIGEPLEAPGLRYSYLYYLASEGETTFRHPRNASGPGKMMALAAYGNKSRIDEEGRKVLEYFLSEQAIDAIKNANIVKENFPLVSSYKNIGVEDQRFKDLAQGFSDAIFDIFYRFAREHLTEGLPLLIGGGCGLNCEWNSRWSDSGIFPSVFVPPCANDTGCAIGTAVDAQFHQTGLAKVDWSVYAGDQIIEDLSRWEGFCCAMLNFDCVASWLEQGAVVAWVQGRCEMGPRALGNRSLLAAPFSPETTRKLNAIKQRESFRPIAPVCMEEDMSTHFSGPEKSPHMLFFHKVRSGRLKAITHVDGSSRVQSVSKDNNIRLYNLLHAFKMRTGVGVLCNTSLNFKGCGFINRTTDLFKYVNERGVDAAVVGDQMYFKKEFC